jgi:hypothetical protein
MSITTYKSADTTLKDDPEDGPVRSETLPINIVSKPNHKRTLCI